jgi:type IV fimbrial biogenesis protein FimT
MNRAMLRHLRQLPGHPAVGFTLLELLVTLAIAGILLTLGVPSFASFIQGQRLKSAASELSYALLFARSEAIKRNADVTVSPNSGGWQNGWTVTTAGATSNLLNHGNAYASLTISGPASSLVYGGAGRLKAVAVPFQVSGSLSGVTPYCVTVDISGLPSSREGSC